jgi:uncharacterized protein
MDHIRHLRANASAAHVAPLAVFLGFLSLPGLLRVAENKNLPWWQAQPELWIYPVQAVVCFALILFWWRHYGFRRPSVSAVAWGVGIGVIGIALWILPSVLSQRTGFVSLWLGCVNRAEDGFDPDVFSRDSAAWWLTVGLRLARMVLVVPFVEEVFWRSWLWRTLAEKNQRWERLPIGFTSVKALILTSLAMASAHATPDKLACVIWALLVGWVVMRTKSLAACVIVHATSNLVLGAYILATRQWGLW